MNSFAKADVLAACAQYGLQLNLPAADDGTTLDGAKLMAAFASNESSMGANCGPRHEPAYDVGGFLATGAQQAGLLNTYGSAAACSYGPWQMMFVNFQDHNVNDLLTSLDICAQEFVRYFNSYVITVRKASNLNEMGQCWNAGHISANPAPGVVAYCNNLQTAYDLQNPAPPQPDASATVQAAPPADS